MNNFKKSRNKSGDSQTTTTDTSSFPVVNGDQTTTEKSSKGGIKGFFRQRSQSDAVAVKNAMLRSRHLSHGSPQAKATPADTLNNNYHAPVQRSRSTSWGAKEKLAFSKQMRISGGNTGPGMNPTTPMSQLIGGGSASGVAINRKVERVSA